MTYLFIEQMLRVYKLYNFAFAASQTNARTTLFSGYPARLSSIDDFYQLSTYVYNNTLPPPPLPYLTFTTSHSKLVVMETTNDVWNRELYVSVTPFSLLSWVRVLVANRMATGGKNWVDIFSRYNSVRTTPHPPHSPTLTRCLFRVHTTTNGWWWITPFSLHINLSRTTSYG